MVWHLRTKNEFAADGKWRWKGSLRRLPYPAPLSGSQFFVAETSSHHLRGTRKIQIWHQTSHYTSSKSNICYHSMVLYLQYLADCEYYHTVVITDNNDAVIKVSTPKDFSKVCALQGRRELMWYKLSVFDSTSLCFWSRFRKFESSLRLSRTSELPSN